MKIAIPPARIRRGFTLIEILVVVGIIALLAALLFPVMSRVREGGRASVCSSNLRQLGLSFRQYVQDSGGRYPGAGQYQKWGNGGHWVKGVNSDNVTGDPGSLAFVQTADRDYRPGVTADIEGGAIYPYAKEPKIYYCPSNPTGAKKRLFLLDELRDSRDGGMSESKSQAT